VPAGEAGVLAGREARLGADIYGLLCDTDGRPVAVEVFTGELHDDKTLPSQVVKLKDRFGLSRVVVVADRGMVTKANIELLKEADGVDWITALKAPTIKKLARSGSFSRRCLTSRTSGRSRRRRVPGERLVVCRNPLVGAQRARKRSELLAATEIDLAAIAHRVTAGTLIGADLIGLATGPALKRYRMRKHFRPRSLTPPSPTPARPPRSPRKPRWTVLHPADRPHRDRPSDRRCRARLQEPRTGRTSVRIDQGPRSADPSDPSSLQDRVRAHVLICMLAYYLTWHLKAAWKPLLFTTNTDPSPRTRSRKPSGPAARSRKRRRNRTSTGHPAHSYRTLLTELSTQTRNTTRLHGHASTFEKLTQPTALQAEALDLAAHAPIVADRRHEQNTPKPRKPREQRESATSPGELRPRRAEN